MKIVAVMGSPRKLETLKVVQRFEEKLAARCEVTFSYIFLKEMNIKPCKGCFLCIEKENTPPPMPRAKRWGDTTFAVLCTSVRRVNAIFMCFRPKCRRTNMILRSEISL